MQPNAEAGEDVSQKNRDFWNTLCGTQLAQSLGVRDSSPESLAKFDAWYMDFYPYLHYYIPFTEMRDKDVLEVGLGYGTISQKIAEWNGRYRGLDIAAGPVAMANQRLSQSGLQGEAVQGSILDAPFESASFDIIVAIGCLHHTGDLQKAIDECFRLLRPNGQLVMMVYYAYSYRRFVMARGETLRYAARELFGFRGVPGQSQARQRAAYDQNEAGEGAPHTDWVSKRSLRAIASKFARVDARTENIDLEKPFLGWESRKALLRSHHPRWWGLDLYACMTKS